MEKDPVAFKFHQGCFTSDRRMDNRFIRTLCKVELATPEQVRDFYGLLQTYVSSLKLPKFAINLYSLSFKQTECLGDPVLFVPGERFPFEISRKALTSGSRLLTIPLLYGYAPPAVIRVEYTDKDRKSIYSLLTIVKIIYYRMRCAGVEQVLHQRDSALLEAVRQGVFDSLPNNMSPAEV